MDKTFLQEAFKALDILNEEDFNLSSSEDIEDLKSFTDEDTSIMDIDVIDPDVTEEDELQDDYIGKVIVDCDVCHSKIYKDPTQIVFSDDSELVNIEDECPFCYSNDGYKIIGMVSPYEETEDVIDISDNETDALDEACKASKKSKHLKEDDNTARKISIHDNDFDKWFIDNQGAFVPEGKLIRLSDIKQYWNDANKSDYILAHYDSYEDWFDNLESDCIKKVDIDESCKTSKKIKRLKENDDTCIDDNCADDDVDEGLLGTVGGIFGGPLGAIGGEIADSAISKINSSKKNEGCKNGKCEDMDELPPRNRERVKRKLYRDMEPVFSDKTKQIKDMDEGCNKQMQRRKLRRNVKEGFNNVSIETDDQILDMNTEDNGKVTITTEPKRNMDTQKEIITPVSDDIQSKINPELEVDAEEEIDVNPEEIDVNPEEFDERSFDRIGESYLKEHYSNIKSLKTSNVTINGNKMIVECIITFTSNNKKKTKFIFESHSINKRGRVKFIGKNKQLNANEQFTLIGHLRNNTLINESLTTNTARKLLRRKSITEGKEIFHNDNGVDYTVIERSVSGKNALLNKGKQWIVAWNCPETNEGSWGQGHYFFDEDEAREVWNDKYLNESVNPMKCKMSRRNRKMTEMRNARRRRLMRESNRGNTKEFEVYYTAHVEDKSGMPFNIKRSHIVDAIDKVEAVEEMKSKVAKSCQRMGGTLMSFEVRRVVEMR